MKTQNKKTGFFGRGAAFFAIAFILIISTVISLTAVFAVDTTQPKVAMTIPTNNQLNVPIDTTITVRFNEAMNPSTINTQTILVLQRSTPQDRSQGGEYRFLKVQGTVTYSGLEATFTPIVPFAPNQVYGNVYTVTVTDGAKDLADNRIPRKYMFSFSSGALPFYTDSSTSQLDQTPILIEPTPTTPTTPVTTTPAPTQNASQENSASWLWILVALIVLVILAIIIATRPTKRKETHSYVPVVVAKKKHGTPSPFGDVSPVLDVEGIGPQYADKLGDMGIKNTKQLWEADAKHVAHKVGVSVSTVESWQEMAELISVKDIGPQYAELLQRSGVHSIAQLKNLSPTRLLTMIQKKQDSLKTKIQGNTLGHSVVANWIEEAKAHKMTISN